MHNESLLDIQRNEIWSTDDFNYSLKGHFGWNISLLLWRRFVWRRSEHVQDFFSVFLLFTWKSLFLIFLTLDCFVLSFKKLENKLLNFQNWKSFSLYPWNINKKKYRKTLQGKCENFNFDIFFASFIHQIKTINNEKPQRQYESFFWYD